MMDHSARCLVLLRATFTNFHYVIVSACVTSIAWLAAYAAGFDPDIAEAAWVFFCMMGILLHRENLVEAYSNLRAVEQHPASNEADLRNIADTVRGEWLRIATKALFILAGLIALLVPPRVNEITEWWQNVLAVLLMLGVALLDIDAVLDKISRRALTNLLIQEINARPLGLSSEDRLGMSIETARQMYHDTCEAFAIVVPVLEAIQRTGQTPLDMDVGQILGHIDGFLSDLRSEHATLRSFDPAAGGPPKSTQTISEGT